MPISALIFDFGNVIAHFDYRPTCEALGRGLGLSGDAFLERVVANGFRALMLDYECGRMASEEFSAAVCRSAGLDIPHTEFAAAWSDIFTLNRPVAELAAGLKRRGYTLVLGSNTNDLHAAQFRRQFAEELMPFDRLVLSYEVGHAKPADEFYRACALAARAEPADCLFIDDLPENIAGARAAGLDAILYRDDPGLHSELNRRGIMWEGPGLGGSTDPDQS